jgi:ankyrin repeat protein
MKRCRTLLLFAFVVLLLSTAAGGLWWHIVQKQNTLNRNLIAALLRDDTKQALELVNAGADVNTHLYPPEPSLQRFVQHLLHRDPPYDNEGATAFMFACGWPITEVRNSNGTYENRHVQNDSSLVKGMLLHGADANTGTGGDYTLLQFAVIDSNADTVELLLRHGAKVNDCDPSGSTPLIWAAVFSHNKVPILLAYNADVNRMDQNGETALYKVVSTTPNKDLIRQLLTHGADPNIATRDGRTALSVAKARHRPDLVALLKSGSKPR